MTLMAGVSWSVLQMKTSGWAKYRVGQYKLRTIKANVGNCLNKR